MKKYIFKRFLYSIVTLLCIAAVTFFMMHAIPGGPFTAERKLPPEVEAAMLAKYDLDKPVPVQFLNYLGGLAKLDLGPSLKYEGRSVNSIISDGFPASRNIAVLAMLFIMAISIPLGVVSAVKNGKWQDMLTMLIATIGITIPSFVIASFLKYIFSFKLNILPTFGLDSWKGYILPIIAMSGYSLAFLARLVRSSLLEVMSEDYIRTAKAKGLSNSKVIIKHALRNAILPVITVMGSTFAGLLTGSFVIEQIFAIPGIGRHFVMSIQDRDYMTIMGITLFYAAILIIMNFVVDIFYSLIDPRIRIDNKN